MDPSGFIEPVIAIIEPTARSTSRVGYIPSTSSIFVKLEDSSSSSIILKCSSMLSNSSILLSSFLFVLQFSCPPLQVPSAFLKSEKPDSWARQQQSSAAAHNFLSSHRTYCWPMLPGPCCPALTCPTPFGQLILLRVVSLLLLVFGVVFSVVQTDLCKKPNSTCPLFSGI